MTNNQVEKIRRWYEVTKATGIEAPHFDVLLTHITNLEHELAEVRRGAAEHTDQLELERDTARRELAEVRAALAEVGTALEAVQTQNALLKSRRGRV